tara:strand:- start:3738 stop:4064 length:327 start_codon:yes stop_codon:yes gene_type:complete
MQCPLDPKLFIAVAMSGEQKEPGRPSCVWVDIAKCSAKYMPLQDVRPPEFATGLREMWDKDGRDYFLVVSIENARAHVFKFPKCEAPRALASLNVATPPQLTDATPPE